MNFWLLLLQIWFGAALFMAAVWIFSYATNNASWVDVAWAYSFTGVALAALLLAHPLTPPTIFLAGMTALWSLRLGTHLLVRVGAHPEREDPRYTAFRGHFPKRTWLVFFGFFQMQALLVVLLSAPLALVATAGPVSLGAWHWAGFGIWMFALAGETLADAQLAAFRRNPANTGKTCRGGLWSWSRHPNYFFEWLVWVAWFVFLLPSPLGFLMVYVPLLMLWFLLRVTGIPATEARAIESRGDEYRRYQQTTSLFLPMPPRAETSR